MSRRPTPSRTQPLRSGRGAFIVLSTAPNLSEARRVAKRLVIERMAACVNVVPGIESLYWWEGRVERGSEALLIIKTRRSRLGQLSRKIQALHSYDVPEILVLPIHAGSPPYLQWLEKSLMMSA